MYKETDIDTKVRATALAKQGFLFWEDGQGAVRLATADKVKTSWGIWRFFACSYPKPRNFVEG